MMIRIFGAALVALCGIYSAAVMNGRAKSTLVQIEGLLELLRFLRSEIECFSISIPRILSRCPRSILIKCGYSEGKFSSLSELLALLDIADDGAASVTQKLASELGRGYREEQLSLCDYYIERLEERRRSLAALLPSRRRVNSALCVSCAVAIVIIFV